MELPNGTRVYSRKSVHETGTITSCCRRGELPGSYGYYVKNDETGEQEYKDCSEITVLSVSDLETPESAQQKEAMVDKPRFKVGDFIQHRSYAMKGVILEYADVCGLGIYTVAFCYANEKIGEWMILREIALPITDYEHRLFCRSSAFFQPGDKVLHTSGMEGIILTRDPHDADGDSVFYRIVKKSKAEKGVFDICLWKENSLVPVEKEEEKSARQKDGLVPVEKEEGKEEPARQEETTTEKSSFKAGYLAVKAGYLVKSSSTGADGIVLRCDSNVCTVAFYKEFGWVICEQILPADLRRRLWRLDPNFFGHFDGKFRQGDAVLHTPSGTEGIILFELGREGNSEVYRVAKKSKTEKSGFEIGLWKENHLVPVEKQDEKEEEEEEKGEEKEGKKEEEKGEKGNKVIPRVFYDPHEGNAFVKVHRKHVEVCDRFDWDVPSELQNQDFWNSDQTAKVTFRKTDVVIAQTFSK